MNLSGVRLAVLERDGYRCAFCGEPAQTIDHLFSKADSRRLEIARDDMRYIRACCRDCNHRKGTRHLVAPAMAEMIPDLNDMTPGRFWFVWTGDPKELTEVLR